MKKYVVVISLVAVLAAFGCASLSTMITPATLDERAVEYAADAGIIEPNQFAGYANLDKARRLESAVKGAYEVNQLTYSQMAERDHLDYAQISNVVAMNRSIAAQREEILFGPEGLLTVGLGMAGAGGLAGLIGLMRKRPGDYTKEDVDTVLHTLKVDGKDKDRQFEELVKGIQAFVDAGENTNASIGLKKNLSSYQSQDTKARVGSVKANL